MRGRLKRVQRLMKLRERAEQLAGAHLAEVLHEKELRRAAVAEQRSMIDIQRDALAQNLATGLRAGRLRSTLSYLDARGRNLARSTGLLNELAPEIEKRRKALLEKRRDRRVLERWTERLRIELLRETDSQEQKELDELGLREALDRMRHHVDEVN